ncbi:MAG: PAS domain-containing protein [Desulfovibrio sp.]|jgi:PAS domain S-box-containing protein|nr:PAS domain-containing protein [Desulfovibrio sp.]
MVDSLRAEKQYRIGLVGDKSSLVPFWELFASLGNERVIGQLGIRALALHSESQAGGGFDVGFELPVHPDWQSMLAAHQDLNLVIETTGREAVLLDLRHGLPSSITLVERGAASFFLRLLSSDQMWVACKLDLLHTQALLKGIIDQLKEEIVLVDAHGNVLDCNKAVLGARGIGKADMAGRPLREFFLLPEEPAGSLDAPPPLEHALETGESAEATLTYTDAGGRVHHTREYVHPLQDEAGRTGSYLCIRRDITGRTQMEQRLQESERLASIGEMSTYIAHEIRNPLFAIGGFANQLMRNVADPAAREKIEIIIEEAKRLDGILKSIVTFARPLESGSGQTDLNSIVRDTMELMGMACETKGISPVLGLAPDLPLVKADPELIKQCLINLVKNSVEAMPGGGLLAVRTGFAGGRIILEVEDTGQGIAPELRDKVMSPFIGTKGRGSGLGLAMVKKIVDGLGGSLELVSVPGAGTRVDLFLPPWAAQAAQPGETGQEPVAKPGADE